MISALAFYALGLSGPASAQTVDDVAAEWELKRDRDGIAVFTTPVAGSKFKAVKATMTVESSLNALVALVQDTGACPEWAAHCKAAEVIDQVNDQEMFVYTLNDMPWPVSDRDAVAHVRWQQDPETLQIVMSATLAPDKAPRVKGNVRLTYGETSWEFAPAQDGQVIVTSRAHIDPGGATPAWLTNRLLVDAPFDTLRGMRSLLATGRYAELEYDFVTEP
ncbi:MAG: START domain-containing protein [Pseudomonadota bacterium]